MDRGSMLLRLGYYSGLAARLLHDKTFGIRWIGRAEEVTEADYLEAVADIQSRLLAAGFIQPDEDPFDSRL